MFTKVKNFIFILTVALILVNTANIILNGVNNAKEYTLTTMLQTLQNGTSSEYLHAENPWATAFVNILHGQYFKALEQTTVIRVIRNIEYYLKRVWDYIEVIFRFINNFFALF